MSTDDWQFRCPWCDHLLSFSRNGGGPLGTIQINCIDVAMNEWHRFYCKRWGKGKKRYAEYMSKDKVCYCAGRPCPCGRRK